MQNEVFFSLNFAIWPLNQVVVQRIRTAVLGQSISGVINTFYVKKIVWSDKGPLSHFVASFLGQG